MEKDLRDTKCEKDYKSRHYWESIGVIGIRPIYQVFKCTQCQKCVTVELDMLVKVSPSDNNHKRLSTKNYQ